MAKHEILIIAGEIGNVMEYESLFADEKCCDDKPIDIAGIYASRF